ncbi:MAG: hypothetical protein ACOYOE_08270 [Chlorobium sp.]
MENHSEDVKLSTLFHYAEVLGKKLRMSRNIHPGEVLMEEF